MIIFDNNGVDISMDVQWIGNQHVETAKKYKVLTQWYSVHLSRNLI